MDLLITPYDGLLGLTEYKTVNESAVYFENEFGIIKDKKVIFHEQDIMIESKEIAYMRLFTQRQKSRSAAALIFMAIAGIIVFSWLHMLLITGLTAVCLIVAALMLRNRENYYIQIVLCKTQQRFIPIRKKQIAACSAFITQYAHYRLLNPEVE